MIDTVTQQQVMTVPTQRTDSSALHPAPPCPEWCDPEQHTPSHFDIPTHHSAPRVWQGTDRGTDAPRVEVQFYRGDEVYTHKALTGDTDMDIRVTGGCEWDEGDDGWPVLNGFMSANEARSFGLWLIALAEEIDPFGTNGVPYQEA